MQALLWPIVSWIFREILVKFIVFTALFALIAFLVPYCVYYLSPYTGTAWLTSAFSAISPGVWFFIDFFNLGFGVPVMISAFVTRFVIRRLPVIG